MPVNEKQSRPSIWLNQRSPQTTCVVLVVAFAVLIGVDRAFPLVGMGPAYIPLIALAGWRLGLAAACAVALTAAFLNIFPNHVADEVPPAVAIARGVLRLSTYAFVVVLVVSLRRSYDRERLAARRDYLTGAFTRAAFDECAVSLLWSAAQGRKALAVVLIDVDGFKGINDRHGHAVGDDTLRILVRTAAAVLGKDDCLGRLGGDEFAAMLCAATVSEAHRKVELFHRALSEGLGRSTVAATVSTGACIVSPGVHTNVSVAMRDADRSMYDAKAHGPGSVRINHQMGS